MIGPRPDLMNVAIPVSSLGNIPLNSEIIAFVGTRITNKVTWTDVLTTFIHEQRQYQNQVNGEQPEND